MMNDVLRLKESRMYLKNIEFRTIVYMKPFIKITPFIIDNWPVGILYTNIYACILSEFTWIH